MTARKAFFNKLIAALVMAVLTCLIAPVHVALSFTPVPMSLGSFMVCLSAAILGARFSLISVGVYLLAGLVGLPVFAGGVSGAAAFTGATGGYLFGYLLCAAAAGAIISRDRFKFHMYPIAMAAGLLLCYAAGVWGLSLKMGLSLDMSLRLGFVPFLLFELIKLAAATLIGYFVGTRLRSFLRY